MRLGIGLWTVAALAWSLSSPASAESLSAGGSTPDVSSARDRMLKLLAQREEQLGALKEFRASIAAEDALYDEAMHLGIPREVERSKLPAWQQRRLSVAIVREARKNGLDPLLVVAVIHCESSFDTNAVSSAGAMGLMQVMPDTGAYLAELAGFRLDGPRKLFDPELNVRLGAGYLADLIRQFGNIEHALVAYNAGPGCAKKILANRAERVKFIAGYPHKVVQTFQKLRRVFAELEQAEREPAPGDASDT
jgi:soluble lytic murein transglycosylase